MNQIAIDQFQNDLRRLEQRFRLTTGQAVFDRQGEAFLQGRPRTLPGDDQRYRVTLARNLRPTRDVQDLPCGVIRSDGAVVGAAWTDGLGQADFRLADGEYTLRYVWHVQDAIDVEILAALSDDLALAYLENSLDDELSAAVRDRVRAAMASFANRGLPGRDDFVSPVGSPTSLLPILDIARILDAFRRANAGPDREDAQPVPAAVLRRLDDGRYDAWRCEATVASEKHGILGAEAHEALAAYATDDGPQPETDERWVQVQGDEVWLRFPAELVPYGVVRLLAMTEDLLVGTCLVPVIKGKAFRRNQCPASWVVGDRDPRTLDWYAQPATIETLPWFTAAEVEALLQRADVQEHDELAGKVRELLELAQQREAEAFL